MEDSSLDFELIPVTRLRQNCTLLICQCSGLAALMDPGGDIDRIEAALRRRDVSLEKIFLTHGHLDHCGAAFELQRRYQVPIEGPHRADDFLIKALAYQASTFSLDPSQVFQPNRWLQDQDRVSFGAQKFIVRHCPGHTPGHVVFWHPEAQIAWVGDVLFRLSIGRTDFEFGDQKQLIASITERVWPWGDRCQFVPGHGPMSTIGQERLDNPYVSDAVLSA